MGHAHIIPALRRQRQEDCHKFEASQGYVRSEFKASLDYIGKLCLRKQTKDQVSEQTAPLSKREQQVTWRAEAQSGLNGAFSATSGTEPRPLCTQCLSPNA